MAETRCQCLGCRRRRQREAGVMVECVGGLLDGDSFDYSLETPPGYVIDRDFGTRRGRRKAYAWIPVSEASPS